MFPLFGRRMRWLTIAVVAMALFATAFFAFEVFHAGTSPGGIEAWQQILEATATIAVAMLYLWREYLENASPRAASPTAQIIQNIYPPSAAVASERAERETEMRGLEALVRRIVEEAGQIECGLVRARRIVIGDERGRERISIGLDASGSPAIAICDEHGAMRVRLAIRENGDAALDLLDGDERRRAMLAVRRDGFGELALLDRTGAIRAALGAAGDAAISYLGLRAECTYALVLEGREVSQSLWDEAARMEWSEPMRRGA
jgi:hypothetical protein